MVDRLDGGVRIVDGRGQRLVSDVDQAAQPEQHVLDHGALEPDLDGVSHRLVQQRGARRGLVGGARPSPGDGGAGWMAWRYPEVAAGTTTACGGGSGQRASGSGSLAASWG